FDGQLPREVFDNLEVAWFLEEEHEVVGDAHADALNVAELGIVLADFCRLAPLARIPALLEGRNHRRAPGVEVAVAARQQLRRRRPDRADAEGVDEAVEGDDAALLDGLHQLGGRLFAPALALADLSFLPVQAEDVAGRGDEAV